MTVNHHPPLQVQSAPTKEAEALPAQSVCLRVVRGALVPLTEQDSEALRRFRLRVGQTVLADIDRPRSPEGLRLLHRFAALVTENVEGFEHLSAHQTIKRLQAESGVGCNIVSVQARDFLDYLGTNLGIDTSEIPRDANRMMTAYQPRSLSMSTMDDAEFQEIFDGLCRYVTLKYWPSLTPEQMANLAEMMPESVP
ncbi:MAG: hypothetical protein AWU57_302 [Marinobacter sp. T13-3]|nr:MAG: hypothetical protein AWU57_302 [Marinobacter sp. T13-3]